MNQKFSKIFILFSLVIFSFSVFTQTVFAVDGWVQQTSSGVKSWKSIASSSDGVKLIAAAQNGYLYTSTDSGVTWTERTSPGSRDWYSVASSADGTKLVAAPQSSYVYTSTDSGVTWSQTNLFCNCWSVASSADGTKLVAGLNGGGIYTSTDGGINWTYRSVPGGTWSSIASSSDGTKLVSSRYNEYIYTSIDSGVNWTQRTAPGSRTWNSIASSSDGTKLVAVAENSYIYTSTDSGVNWTQQTNSGSRTWRSVASSSDGAKLKAGTSGGYIYTSTDSGVTWVQDNSSAQNWFSIASSSDGTALAASTYGGYIYTYGALTSGTVQTLSASSESFTSAVLSGNITSVGSGVTARGVEYGLSTSYGSTNSGSNTSNYSTGSYSLNVYSLTCNTVYHFRAYVTTLAGTTYGNDATFSTIPCYVPPTTIPDSILYGVDGSGSNPNPPKLYTIDKDAGVILSTIGLTGHNLTGIAFHPTTHILYGVSGGNDIGGNAKSLFTINTTTGVATLLGALKTAGNTAVTLPDIAFKSNGTLYGFEIGGARDLYTVDITSCDGTSDINCLVTVVGDSGLNPWGNGIIFDNNDNLYFFGNGDDSYYKINSSTGAVIEENVFTNPNDLGQPIAAAAKHPDGTIYASRLNYGDPEADLVSINITTHTITTTGANNPDMVYMDAIAFSYDLISPTVTTTSSSPSHTTTVVGWTTHEASSTQIEYGLTTSYGTTTSETDTTTRVLSHSVTLSNLAPCTLFHYRTVSRDVSGNIGYSADHEFTTACASASVGGPVPIPSTAYAGGGSISCPIDLTTLKCAVVTISTPIPTTQPIVPVATCTTVPSTPTLLKLNMTHSTIKLLQQYLNCKGYTVATAGAGSLNNETTKFGALTKKAVIKFQIDNNLKGDGVVGALTRSKMGI